MKISLNRLRQLIPLNYSIDQISAMLTSMGLEVEDVLLYESVKGGLKGVVIGEVITCQPHPNADKLKLTQVNTSSEILQIVCGAPNVTIGQKVLVATVGSTIYPLNGEPLTLKKTKIRGEESQGMICAEDELGLGESHQGIIVLPPSTSLDQTAAEVVGVYTDTIFEIGLTPNRSDANSHIGVAYDLQAYIHTHGLGSDTVTKPAIEAAGFNANERSPIEVEIQNPEKCQTYFGLVIDNVQVKESSPWLQNFLLSIGLKPINNVVDITNYVLHTFGQPLHAFDASCIKGGKIIVKTLPEGTPFTGLDGVTKVLTGEDLMICDSQAPLCMAGVFGGQNSGVNLHTNKIFLEGAVFEPTTIRRSSIRHGWRTDAATHFEKGVDVSLTQFALQYAAQLICDEAGGKINSSIVEAGTTLWQPKLIAVRYQKVDELIGFHIPEDKIKLLLHNLGFTIMKEDNTQVTLQVPFRKNDITMEADVVEEIIRLYGLDNLPMAKAVRAVIPIAAHNKSAAFNSKAAHFLAANGFYQILNNSLTKSSYYSNLEEAVPLLNSINTELNMLRMSLIHGAMEVIAHNANRQQYDLKIFEFGKVYSQTSAGQYSEKNELLVAVSGNQSTLSWQTKATEADFYFLKSHLAKLMHQGGIGGLELMETEHEMLHPAFTIFNQQKVKLGVLGAANDNLLKQFSVKQTVWLASLDWDMVWQCAFRQKVSYLEVSKFPTVKRDLSMIVGTNIRYEKIEAITRQLAGDLLQELSLFDIFEDKKLGEGRKSFGVSITLQDPSQTLTDERIDKLMQKLMKRLETELAAEIRKN